VRRRKWRQRLQRRKQGDRVLNAVDANRLKRRHAGALDSPIEDVMHHRLMALAAVALLAVTPLQLAAQTAADLPTAFPPGAAALGADDLKVRLAGKLFRVTRADGNHWRLQFNDNGYFFINTQSGFADDGRWRTEGSQLCTEARRGTSGCIEARLLGDQLYFKRAVNGEIVRYELQ
jgi:hypothetical protein